MISHFKDGMSRRELLPVSICQCRKGTTTGAPNLRGLAKRRLSGHPICHRQIFTGAFPIRLRRHEFGKEDFCLVHVVVTLFCMLFVPSSSISTNQYYWDVFEFLFLLPESNMAPEKETNTANGDMMCFPCVMRSWYRCLLLDHSFQMFQRFVSFS